MSNVFEGYLITSPFGFRNEPFTGKRTFHTRIDLVKSHKAPIHAFTSGIVTHAKFGATGSGFGGCGNVVAIKDKNGCLHVYAHLDGINVKIGANISKGQVIGTQGYTGKSTGSHLHYEVCKTSSPSFGWIADRANNCFEPTAYLKSFNLVPYPSSLIRNSSRWESVKLIQRIVGTTVDGIFGPKTEAAVKAFQKKNKLVADGIVGQKTWNKMIN